MDLYYHPGVMPEIQRSFFTLFFFFKIIYLFIYFWLHWVFVAARGLCLVVAIGLLIAVAPLVAELRL